MELKCCKWKIGVFFALAVIIGATVYLVAYADAPPPNAIERISDPSFEDNVGCWTFIGDTGVDTILPRTGMFSMWQGGDDAWGYAYTQIDTSACDPRQPVWVTVWANIQTSWPVEEPYFDVTEGWIANSQHVTVLDLWELYEVDSTGDWMLLTFRVDELVALLESGIGYLYIGSSTNDPGSEFWYDDVQVLCVPLAEYRVFLPLIRG